MQRARTLSTTPSGLTRNASLTKHPNHTKTHGSLDQPANPKACYPSLKYQTGCLIVVDTFRAAQLPEQLAAREKPSGRAAVEGLVFNGKLAS